MSNPTDKSKLMELAAFKAIEPIIFKNGHEEIKKKINKVRGIRDELWR